MDVRGVKAANGHVASDEVNRAPCLGTRRVETHFTQEQQDVHRRVPPVVPRRSTPPAIGGLEGEQPCAKPLGCDARPFSRDFIGGCVGQVAQYLPADRRVRIEPPAYDRMVRNSIASSWLPIRKESRSLRTSVSTAAPRSRSSRT